MLRVLIGTTYLFGAASVAMIFAADPGQDTTWGLRLFSLSLFLSLVLAMLLVYRLRLDSLRLLLPWYGIPYEVWLIGSPPRQEGPGAVVA